ncbi:hypothetical protein EVAR_76404_1 [Eumeta japonica]|uniref:Uncharacterized protein n=1 Tax=Eumeta variegata TaxID=151549 RepID=A0A4C1TAR6_EUMVA|nr:hypothetical protein EVAR_76404_1 [Eumeta japonica]
MESRTGPETESKAGIRAEPKAELRSGRMVVRLRGLGVLSIKPMIADAVTVLATSADGDSRPLVGRHEQSPIRRSEM